MQLSKKSVLIHLICIHSFIHSLSNKLIDYLFDQELEDGGGGGGGGMIGIEVVILM